MRPGGGVTAAFGTLKCLEPAIAVVVGLLALGQVPGPAPVIGIAFVVTAGLGAERTGSRSQDVVPTLPTINGVRDGAITAEG